MAIKAPAPTTSPASEARPPHAERASAHLLVIASKTLECVGARVELAADLVLLGRDVQSDGLCIADERLSRVHARIAFDARAGAYRIGDGRSRNGTFVNGRRTETALLFEGDVIRAGDTLLVYGERDAGARLRAELVAVAKLPSIVLLRGETGTGKELAARALHAHSGRGGAFVPVNCASIPAELVGAEFFGHTRNAFSGAASARRGLFAAAEGGTLFLDEIGDCPAGAQATLLRALQEKAIRPVGAEHEQAIDVRVIAATHADLEAGAQSGAFRPDLLARLSQVTLRVPALRERRAELPALMAEIARELGVSIACSIDALEALSCWHWPFNVRELQSLVHACRAASVTMLDLDRLRELRPDIAYAFAERRHAGADALRAAAPDAGVQRQRLERLLAEHRGNVSAVAKALGCQRPQVYRWMKAFGLAPGRFKSCIRGQ